MLQSIFYSLPDIAGLLLVLVSLAMIFVPDKLNRYRKLRWAVVIILLVIGIGGIVSNSKEKSELTKRIEILITSAQIQPTGDDIKRLTEVIRTQPTGDDVKHLTEAINELKTKMAGIVPPKVEKPPPPPQQPQLPPPIVEHIKYIQRRAPSNKPEFPYGLQIIVQTDITLQPVALAIECDGEINEFGFFMGGQMVYMSVYKGIIGSKNNIAILKFAFPPVTPETPLVITILSKTDVRVKGIKRLQQ
jgi:hypothetical protein